MSITRRSFLGAAAAAPLSLPATRGGNIPIGLELYSVRHELEKDPTGTVRKMAQIGYKDVEFFAPYYNWTTDQAKDMRKLLDSLNIRCLSTHNAASNFRPENLGKAIELNKILGTRFVVMSSAGRVNTLDGWRKVADTLTAACEKLRPEGLRGGYHNHQLEFTPLEGKRPIEVIAAHTPKDFMLQLDVGTCVEVGSDPVAWINANPGRINSLHLKDWDKEHGYRVLFGEGAVPWKQVLAAARKKGGVEFYLIEQEGSDYSEFDTAERCLANFRKLRGA
jgi:sugar phosphate isomerase/epimerase